VAKLRNYFVVTGSAATLLDSFAHWLISLPASERPKTIAYATSNDPFAEPAVLNAKQELQAAGIKTVYSDVFPAEVTDYTPIADGVAASKAQAVVIGSTSVPDIAPLIQRFAVDHYNPEVIIGESGPDQGTTFSNAVGIKNTEAIMFPNDWYPGIANPGSKAMVSDYVRTYGGKASNVSADIAEAFAVGQVLTAAVNATHSLSNSKIIAYLHSGVSISTVLGTVRFGSQGYNVGTPTVDMQWQHGKTVQVTPAGAAGTSTAEFPKPAWGCATCG
jgi:branched-chain amino acid transport system substrate-binding protein